MLDVAFAVPGDLDAPTGGYRYARELLRLLPAHGVGGRHVALPGSFPHPSAADLAESGRRLKAERPAAFLIDGLAFGAFPPDLVAGIETPVVALVHHPLGLENGLTPERRSALIASETEALTLARRIVVTSEATGRLLTADFGVPTGIIAVAEPGTEPAPRARGTGAPVTLLAVGAVSPRKGCELLVTALGELKDLDWRLTIAGSLDRAPDAARALQEAIAASRLGDRVRLAGAVDDAALARLYDEADIFVSPSLFEGYGMVLAEAMARGLPLVASTGGAAAETVPAGTGLKVPPDDVAAMREALRRMIGEPDLRGRAGEASWAAGRRLPRWTDTAAKVAAALRQAAS